MKIINWVLLIILSLAFFGCEDDSPEPDIPQKLKITTLEKVSRIPVPDATISLYKCSNFDAVFGCTKYQVVKTLKTNVNGEVEYSPINGVEAMEASHPDYWDNFNKAYYGEILLSPNSWVKLQLQKIGDYNPGSYVHLQVTRECNNCGMLPYKINFNENIGLPADTTFVIKVEGTENTTIFWEVISPPAGVVNADASEPFVVSKFDTLSMKIQY
ncbi:hypothetical protein [Shivajiella indica]|uniref:Uncharacterized protein n=1 Tax=Shivajiella indica TaxID=872115 RepID=A0ABW5BCS6_9BACT